jgi:hypothetical protein
MPEVPTKLFLPLLLRRYADVKMRTALLAMMPIRLPWCSRDLDGIVALRVWRQVRLLKVNAC